MKTHLVTAVIISMGMFISATAAQYATVVLDTVSVYAAAMRTIGEQPMFRLPHGSKLILSEKNGLMVKVMDSNKRIGWVETDNIAFTAKHSTIQADEAVVEGVDNATSVFFVNGDIAAPMLNIYLTRSFKTELLTNRDIDNR